MKILLNDPQKMVHCSAVTRRERFDCLDYAKGIGIYLVVLTHVINRQADSSASAEAISYYIYSFHMPLFFILSGIGLGIKYKDSGLSDVSIRTFAGNIGTKLLVPYFLWSALYTLIATLEKINVWNVVLHTYSYATLTGRGIAPLWFLAALFVGEVVMIACIKLCERMRVKKYCAAGMVTALFGSLSPVMWLVFLALPEMDDLALFPITMLLRTVPTVFFLGCGYMAGMMWEKIDRASIAMKSAAAVTCIVTWIFIQTWRYNSVNIHLFSFSDMPSFIASGALGSAAVILLCACLPNGIKPLSAVGWRSMDIMVLHYPPIPAIELALLAFSSIGWQAPYYLTALMVLAMAFLTSVLLVDGLRWIFKKIKSEDKKNAPKKESRT